MNLRPRPGVGPRTNSAALPLELHFQTQQNLFLEITAAKVKLSSVLHRPSCTSQANEMSFGHKHAYDTHFGPPSALINVSGFLQSARDLQEALDLQQSRCGEPSMSAPALRGTAYQTWIDTPSNKREEIEAECRYVKVLFREGAQQTFSC